MTLPLLISGGRLSERLPVTFGALVGRVSAGTEETLELLPRYYDLDPNFLGTLTSARAELARVEAMLLALRAGGFPQHADDSYRLLGVWETLLGLPEEPGGLTVAQRRNKVLGQYRARKANSGEAWQAALSTFMGLTPWAYAENTPDPYTLTVTVGYLPGSDDLGRVTEFLRRITPAHIELVVNSEAGFVVDMSRVDQEAI